MVRVSAIGEASRVSHPLIRSSARDCIAAARATIVCVAGASGVPCCDQSRDSSSSSQSQLTSACIAQAISACSEGDCAKRLSVVPIMRSRTTYGSSGTSSQRLAFGGVGLRSACASTFLRYGGGGVLASVGSEAPVVVVAAGLPLPVPLSSAYLPLPQMKASNAGVRDADDCGGSGNHDGQGIVAHALPSGTHCSVSAS